MGKEIEKKTKSIQNTKKLKYFQGTEQIQNGDQITI